MSSVRIICKRKKKKLKRLLKLSYVKLINLTVFLSLESPVRHLHISHNAPHSPPKNLHNFVFHFSWVLQPSQGTLKTMLKYNLGGGGVQIRCIMADVQVANIIKNVSLYS